MSKRHFIAPRSILLLLTMAGGVVPVLGCRSKDIPLEQSIPTWQRTELYFGLTRRDGSEVSEAQWKKFVEERIVPSFPAGFTVLSGDGRWRDDSGKIHAEPSRILVVMYRASDDSADMKLRRIAEKYAEAFDQEVILRADLRPRVEFIYAPAPAPTTAVPTTTVPVAN